MGWQLAMTVARVATGRKDERHSGMMMPAVCGHNMRDLKRNTTVVIILKPCVICVLAIQIYCTRSNLPCSGVDRMLSTILPRRAVLLLWRSEQPLCL